jgi:hypothetical protein
MDRCKSASSIVNIRTPAGRIGEASSAVPRSTCTAAGGLRLAIPPCEPQFPENNFLIFPDPRLDSAENSLLDQEYQ